MGSNLLLGGDQEHLLHTASHAKLILPDELPD